jgi:hypothetical protein
MAHCLNAIENAFLPCAEGEEVTNKADYRRLKAKKIIEEHAHAVMAGLRISADADISIRRAPGCATSR